MNTDIRSLQLLERDLEAAAERERVHLASGVEPSDGGPGGPRRLPRRGRGHAWRAIAAALAAVLVLAGGIGFLSQGAGPVARRGSLDGADSAGAGSGGSGADAPLASQAPAPEERADGALDFEAPSFSNFAPGATEQDTAGGTGGSEGGIGTAPRQQGDLTKVIRDGRIGIVIADGSFSKGVARVIQIARQNRGFVLESTSRDERSGTMTLRIPAKRFDDSMLALRALAGELDGAVEFQDISGQDVTAEFIDLGARLDILKERRDLLRELQREATSSNEILRLAGLIEDVQLQIETIQGRLRFLKDQVAEATIKVEVRERDVEREDPGPNPENPSLGDSFELAVQGFLQVVGAVVVGLGYLIPLGAVALVAWGVVRLVRRRDRAAS
jgi:hypothetical protein